MTPRAREHRFRRLKELGCLCCDYTGLPNVHPEIHHLNLGGHAGQKRLGDEFTIPICGWHHRGIPFEHYDLKRMRAAFGPSLARNSRAFHEAFGSDEELLAKTNEKIKEADVRANGALSEAHVSMVNEK